MASIGQRLVAYLIDVIAVMILGLGAGYSIENMAAAGKAVRIDLIAAGYLLLRDVGGASLGKLVLGLRVVGADGARASVGQRVLRNLTLAIGPALAGLPLLDLDFVRAVRPMIGFVDGIFLFAGGQRLGDKIARTAVVRRQTVDMSLNPTARLQAEPHDE